MSFLIICLELDLSIFFLFVCVHVLLLFFVLLLLLILGSVCLGFFLFFFSSLAAFCVLRVLGSLARVRAWACRMEGPILGPWAARESLTPGNINPWELAWRPPSRHQDLALLTWLQAPVLDTSCQTASKAGTQPHPSADRLPKDTLSSPIQPNTPLHAALPVRRKRLRPPKSRHCDEKSSIKQTKAYWVAQSPSKACLPHLQPLLLTPWTSSAAMDSLQL